MIRRVGLAATTSLVAGVIALVAAAPAIATPKDDPPVSGDARATAYSGNVTTCAQVPSLKGSEELEVEFKIIDKKYVNITKVPEGFELTGTVVKGGDNYNVYLGDVRTMLHAPLVGKDNKNIPEISHWFACGKKKKETPPTPPTPPTQPPGNPPPGNPPANNPAPQAGNAAATGSELADTGASTTVPLVLGAALLLLGSGLVLAMRRRQHG